MNSRMENQSSSLDNMREFLSPESYKFYHGYYLLGQNLTTLGLHENQYDNYFGLYLEEIKKTGQVPEETREAIKATVNVLKIIIGSMVPEQNRDDAISMIERYIAQRDS